MKSKYFQFHTLRDRDKLILTPQELRDSEGVELKKIHISAEHILLIQEALYELKEKDFHGSNEKKLRQIELLGYSLTEVLEKFEK